MFWLKTGVLSDIQIKKLLGKKIFIWPFKNENLKGSTYNLTASCVAFSVNNGNKLLINDNDEIVIPPNDIALIETDESIFVGKDICGTYHSKVKLVSMGLGHIGTTLDPLFFGPSLIAVSNNSINNVKIKVGDTFASLMFYKMPSSTKVEVHDNLAFRSDIVKLEFTEKDFFYEIKDKDKTLKKISDWKNASWRSSKKDLIENVKFYIKERDATNKIKLVSFIFNILIPFILVLFIIPRLDDIQFIKNYSNIIYGLIYPLSVGIGKFFKEYIRS